MGGKLDPYIAAGKFTNFKLLRATPITKLEESHNWVESIIAYDAKIPDDWVEVKAKDKKKCSGQLDLKLILI